ncbi:MAG: hypothetical protein JXM79_01710, partial [Sedimentisphaerales bacterium]|nr:hypothetical protein [Sedimentisphaerales bacterium]
MDESEQASKKCPRLTIWRIFVLLLLIAVVAFAAFRFHLKWKLNTRIEAIRAAGYPVTCAELDAWYTIPDDAENAAFTILDALSFYQEWDKDKLEGLPLAGQAELPARTEALAAEMKTRIAEYIADNNEAIEWLHAGAEIEHCRYPVDFTAGFKTRLNHLPNMRRAAMLLNLEALLHAENNETDAAVHSVISGFGFARSLSMEPCSISQLSRRGCHLLLLSTLERIINRADLTDGQLIELSEYLYDIERTSDISRAFVGERCIGLGFFTAPHSLDPDVFEFVPPRPILLLSQAIGLVDMDAVIFLDIMKDQLEAIRLPYHQREKVTDAIEKKLGSKSKIHILAHELTPFLSRLITIEIKTIAHLRTTRTGLAVQHYRLAAGALPDTLSQLVPAYLDAVP